MSKEPLIYDALIIGAGAAGLFCAQQLGQAGLKTAIIEKNDRPGKKIIISGGGRCNFTNLEINSDSFQSTNKHFFKSALARYPAEKFIKLVKKYKISFYEKKLGQLFCHNSSKEILNMLLCECQKGDVKFHYGINVLDIKKENSLYKIKDQKQIFLAKKLIIATGGLSMPKIGASDFGYKLAKSFGHKIIPTKPALVPFTNDQHKKLAGISVPVEISFNKQIIADDLLFTHKGLSGPAILKISLYYEGDDPIFINFLPNKSVESILRSSNQEILNLLSNYLPSRFIKTWLNEISIPLNKKNFDLKKEKIQLLTNSFHQYAFYPKGNEGFRKAEVTKGGVDTRELSSKTMESKFSSNLFFIGEVIDVTGQLGGFNFQWAWSSAFACANYILNTSFAELHNGPSMEQTGYELFPSS